MARNQDPEAEAIERYRLRFEDSPPYWALTDPNVVERLRGAIKRGKPLADEGTERPIVA